MNWPGSREAYEKGYKAGLADRKRGYPEGEAPRGQYTLKCQFCGVKMRCPKCNMVMSDSHIMCTVYDEVLAKKRKSLGIADGERVPPG